MNYQEFILEVNKHREQKLMYQYGERNKPENYLPKDPVKYAKEVKLAQIVPTSKNNQIPFKHVPIGIDITDREEGLKKKVRTMERLGILHGDTRAKDLP